MIQQHQFGRRLKAFRTGYFTPLLLVTALLGACARAPKLDDASIACRSLYTELDRKIDAAGVRDASAHRLAGFPYLRSNRFLASFTGELEDTAAFRVWLDRLAQLDLDAREIELRNLGDGVSILAKLATCSQQLAAQALQDPDQRQQLIRDAAVPDDYSLLKRSLGFYPLTAQFLKLGISGYHEEVRSDYAQPLEMEVDGSPLFLWSPPKPVAGIAEVEQPVAKAERDTLGIPMLSTSQWEHLAEAHAPAWWVETSGDYDFPGAPGPGASFDPRVHQVYFYSSYTRFEGEVLPQLNYLVWFSARPPLKALDPYAGALDGILWRVTLDRDGLPLIYDTIHACGCYHYYFPVQPLRHQAEKSFWQEPMLVPQESAPAQAVAVRVQSATHYVRRVVTTKEAAAHSKKRRSYNLRPYRDLLSLPDDHGGTRSLFATDGLVDGSERGERWWLWISGISSPGAMRQSGRHATAFVGREHFDDPWLLQKSFSRSSTIQP